MTDDQDNEHGSYYWNWIAHNAELSKNDPTDLLNTFVAFLRDETNRVVVATGSIVMDDREMGKHLHLNEALWIGGINVHREFRGRGLGTILFACLDKHIQEKIRKSTNVCLFTNNQGAKKIYQQYGFRSQGFIHNKSLKTEDKPGRANELFTKIYPSASYRT